MTQASSHRIVDGRKHCPACDTVQPIDDFYQDRNTSSGLRTYCRSCDMLRVKARRDRIRTDDPARWEAERLRISRRWLMHKYGITPERYAEMLAKQGGVCAICARPERKRDRAGRAQPLGVDHNHACCSGSESCGQCVRGLLCDDCNNGIGRFADNADRLMAAVAYLLGGGPDQD